MKFKLDENFGNRTERLFLEAGHDVRTIRQQSMQGASDQSLYEACRVEGRCIVTLDLDFSNILRFSPRDTSGIVVVRAPGNLSLPILENLVCQFLRSIENMSIEGRLWIIEPGRIRIHHADD
ncbi:MAG: hypothetical protein GY759_04940 [Chloroflexi bacterium]|nr:hypothetical protein [Chloroflexota bacterium]